MTSASIERQSISNDSQQITITPDGAYKKNFILNKVVYICGNKNSLTDENIIKVLRAVCDFFSFKEALEGFNQGDVKVKGLVQGQNIFYKRRCIERMKESKDALDTLCKKEGLSVNISVDSTTT